jgi:hypothetical protein
MKKRMILIAILGVIFTGGGIWFVPHRLLAQTHAPATDHKLLYYTCPMHPAVKSEKPGSCPICGMNLVAVYDDEVETNNPPSNNTPSNGTNSAAIDATAKPYPLTTCVVDGMDLHSMGEPYGFVYQGQQIKLCCAGCKPQFLKTPDIYLKKITDAENAAKP